MRKNYKLDCTFLKQPVISNNGDVQFCPFMRIKLGNITKQTFDEIYSSEKYKRLKETIYKHNLLPVCERCCGLEVSE